MEDVSLEAPSAELARSLPTLIEELRALREAMETKSKAVEAILSAPPSKPANVGSERASLFTPMDLDRSSFDHRPSDQYPPYLSHSGYETRHTYAGSTSLSRLASRPSSSSGRKFRECDYTVMWVSGECGISLRTFSARKIGAQIAVLQHADGVTTGIANCRLGDQLVTVNDQRVEDFRFKDIVQTLKNTRRPISLGFRNNPNVVTSPRSSIHGSEAFAHTAPVHSTRPSMFQEEHEDRPTNTSATSTTSTLSDDMELWCKEQEELNSGLLVLLTETVLRCEKLQQENLDQMQNLMHLTPSEETSAVAPMPVVEITTEVEEVVEEEQVVESPVVKRRAPPPLPPSRSSSNLAMKVENLVV